MELGNFTSEQLQCVKHVLFGKQKQANVTNEAVVKLVAGDLVAWFGGTACLSSEEEVKKSIKVFLQDTVDGKLTGNDTTVLLIAGEQSYNCLKSAGPKVVSVDEPNPDSPKVLFRIYVLGEVPAAEVDSYVKIGAGPTLTPAKSETADMGSEAYNYKVRVDNLVKEILPLVPEGVKKELSDPVAQCLCCAEYYYNL